MDWHIPLGPLGPPHGVAVSFVANASRLASSITDNSFDDTSALYTLYPAITANAAKIVIFENNFINKKQNIIWKYIFNFVD